MECQKSENIKRCNCSYLGCEKKGLCCECLQYHLARRELPACCFPADAEATFDRSFEKFIEVHSKQR
ncbi:cytosolic protein [Candidatus Woesearchaeota archaeon]|nr:cytosolic protein [Candidatus Woesearchaeota archaeon]